MAGDLASRKAGRCRAEQTRPARESPASRRRGYCLARPCPDSRAIRQRLPGSRRPARGRGRYPAATAPEPHPPHSATSGRAQSPGGALLPGSPSPGRAAARLPCPRQLTITSAGRPFGGHVGTRGQPDGRARHCAGRGERLAKKNAIEKIAGEKAGNRAARSASSGRIYLNSGSATSAWVNTWAASSIWASVR